MLKLAQQMGASLAGAGYKFSIVETHHVTKVDKPSGTAISIAEMVAVSYTHLDVYKRQSEKASGAS